VKPRHSVIIFTYNQDILLARALDSILCQKEYVYEIIVCDDCSTDNTWDLIQEYQKKYPSIIKPFSSIVNQGIFENIENSWSKVEGEIVWYLAGDDEYCIGLFEEANRLIEKHNIDFINEAFTLYFDFKLIDPNGNETIFRNNLVEHYNAISLKIRQLIYNRTTGFSKKVLEQFHPVRKDIGIYADALLDIQIQLFSDNNYYSRFVGSIYYTGIGMASRANEETLMKSLILSQQQLQYDILNLTKDDKHWLNYRQRKCLYLLNPSLHNYLSYLKIFILMIQKYYGWSFIKREITYILKDTARLVLYNMGLRKPPTFGSGK
jgi:glycosyltransferase involved in cell wall biosynthesis